MFVETLIAEGTLRRRTAKLEVLAGLLLHRLFVGLDQTGFLRLLFNPQGTGRDEIRNSPTLGTGAKATDIHQPQTF